jgi:peptidyl-prolyl cis-trans isomerase C
MASRRFFRVKYLIANGMARKSARAVLAGLACTVLPNLCLAQPVPTANSPAAPLDLTKPQFDTTTPHYDVTGVPEKAATTVVADVSGHAITLGELGDMIRALPPTLRTLPFDQVYPAALNQLIRNQSLVVRAISHGLDKDPIVQRRVKTAANKALVEEMVQREGGASITEKMLLDRYDQLFAGKPGPEEVHLRVILVATEEEATAIIAELAGGADFSAVALRSSRDSSAPQAGDLGYLRRENLTPEIGAVAFQLASGHTTSFPVRTAAGWSVLRVDDRRLGEPPPFVKIHDAIRDMLLRESVENITRQALSEVYVQSYDIAGAAVQAQVRSEQ